MQIRSIEHITSEDLYTAFNQAFKDYSHSWTEQQFNNMLQRRGFVKELSFGAFDNDKLVSFILNGIGTFNNKQTVYDTGTGTIKDYRGQGLIKEIFNASLPALKSARCEQYLLEVLSDNEKAISIYVDLGFKVNRTFNYFVKEVNEIKNTASKDLQDYEFKEIELVPEIMSAMQDFDPSWQNNFSAILKNTSHFKIIGAFKNNKLLAYGIIEPTTGDIPQLAVDKKYRRKGIGSYLLNELIKYNTAKMLRLINIENNTESVSQFLKSKNLEVSGSQFEMIRVL